MPYRYLDDIAIADAAFEAWGETVEEMLLAASDAAVNVMVTDLDSIAQRVSRKFGVEDPQLDMLVFKILQELIYFKDSEKLLLRVRSLQVERLENSWSASVETFGEGIDPNRHELAADVKAVTLHRLHVESDRNGWRATVVLDV